MFDTQKVEYRLGGRKLVLETGRMARQADGAVLATYGDTTVLATVVSTKEPKPGVDFFPLTVNYQENYYAAGRIPGGFFKREGRPTEKETLTSRLIDRPIRPLFADGLQERDAGRRHRALLRPGERSRHRRHGRRVRRADAFRRALHGPDRRGARRLHQRQLHPQSDGRGREDLAARPHRRRHHRRRDDGGIGSPGAVRGSHARRRHVRPPRASSR